MYFYSNIFYSPLRWAVVSIQTFFSKYETDDYMYPNLKMFRWVSSFSPYFCF
eukprot:UN00590